MRDFRISRGAVEFGTKYIFALVGVVSLAFFSTGCTGLVGASKSAPNSTAAPTVAITAPAVGATESGSVTVSAAVADGVSVTSVQFQLDGATVGSPLTASPYKYVWDTTKSANGTHTLRASATDANGNVGSSSSISVIVQNSVDTTPPTVSITAPANGSTDSGTITVTANASDNVAVASVQFRVDGNNVGAPVTFAPYTYSLNTTTLANGSHTLTAVAKDTSGNTATSAAVSITVNNPADTTPPTVSITAPANGSTDSGTITVTANASDNVAVASVQFRVDGNNVGAAVTFAPYTYSLNTTTLANGSHTLTAVAKDASGNTATSAAVAITVNNAADTTPPTVSITAPANGSTDSGTITVIANASDNVAVASVQFRVDGNNVGAAVTFAPYTYSLNTTTLANGSHTLTAVAKDTSGNTATSAAVAITVSNASTSGPAVSITSPLAGIMVSGTITVTATASDNSGAIASVQFEVDGSSLGAADTTSPYSQSWNTTTVVDGPHTLTAVATPNGTSQQPATASAVVIVNNSGAGSALSSTPGWHVIPSSALCGGGAQKNASYADPDNFPSNLNSSYPSYGFGFTSQCYNILEDSNSAAYDTLRHRMILYGGGHQHYWGNDVFSLELSLVNTSAPTAMFHLDHSADPITCPSTGPAATTVTESNGAICRFDRAGTLTIVFGHPGCSYVIGCMPTQLTTPSSVHTYNTTVYIPGYDEMTVFGGASAPQGSADQNAWLLSMSSVLYTCAPNTTTNQQGCDPTWTPIGNPALNTAYVNTDGVGSMATYDPNTQGVWTQNTSGLEWFNPANNTLTVETTKGIGYHSTGVLDPVDKYLILVGPQSTSPAEGILYIDVACNNPPACTGSNFTLNQPTTTGCTNLTGGTNANPQYMGAQWDPIGRRVAIYPNTGNVIWYIDPTTWTCSSETYGSTQGTDYPQDTPLPLGDAGTFGHFGYDPVLDVFILCNDPHNNCWYLRPNR
jgi:NADPH-dependent 7-cyano-7-deazaguanine reductase QueF-like protein